MNGRELAVAIVVDEATERVSGVQWSDLDLCRCWTEPARIHSGHCCMATADLWCHQVEGMAAINSKDGK